MHRLLGPHVQYDLQEGRKKKLKKRISWQRREKGEKEFKKNIQADRAVVVECGRLGAVVVKDAAKQAQMRKNKQKKRNQ